MVISWNLFTIAVIRVYQFEFIRLAITTPYASCLSTTISSSVKPGHFTTVAPLNEQCLTAIKMESYSSSIGIVIAFDDCSASNLCSNRCYQ